MKSYPAGAAWIVTNFLNFIELYFDLLVHPPLKNWVESKKENVIKYDDGTVPRIIEKNCDKPFQPGLSQL